MAAWTAASTGYLAGLAEESLRLALEHARSRHAFGAPLAALEPVQQMLADAATLVDGLRLLAGDLPGTDALAHAGEAAERTLAICMQVTGALGFTLEFPLQRAYRRSRAARSWADAVLLSWEAAGAMSAGQLPLAGLRVLDYGQYVAGPFATMLLADLGADVVKVEPPRGDEWRRYDPFEEGESRYFYALNRGKRSVALDLKSEDGPRAQPRADRRRGRARAQLPAGARAPLRPRRRQRARGQPALRDGLRVGVRQRRARCRPARVRPDRPGALGAAARRPARGRSGAAAHRRARARRLHRRAARRPGGGRRPARPPRAAPPSSRCRCSAPRSRSRRSGSWRWTAATSRPAAAPFADALGPRAAGRRRWRRSRRSTPTTARTPAPTASSRSPASTPSSGARCATLLGLEDPFADNPQAEPGRTPPSASAAPRTCGRSRRASPASAWPRPWRRWPPGACRPARCAGSTSSSTTSRCAPNGLVQIRRAAGRGRRCACSGASSRSTAARARAAGPRPGSDEHSDELLGAPIR